MSNEKADYYDILRIFRGGLESGSISICDLSALEYEISVMYRDELTRLINSIEQRQIKGYMLGRGFKLEATQQGLLIWGLDDVQVLTPTDRGYRDYYRCLYAAIEQISEIDGHDISDVVDSILKFKFEESQ